MSDNAVYDVAIIGGGLAGLASSILLSKQGHSVVLLEKEKYPFHKVCGEYVSMESWDFLESLGVPLSQMKLPLISSLFLTSTNGRSFQTKLPLGGFGISRYKLDSCLASIAGNSGVQLIEEVKVQNVVSADLFTIEFISTTGEKRFVTSKICCVAHGKRGNLDVKWNREFLKVTDKKLDNHVGVKYHIKTNWENNVIGLHNFEGGYCGISQIEEGKFCLCYMANAEGLKNAGGTLENFEQKVLWQNPFLKQIFSESERCEGFPVSISQISFQSKSQVENGMLMLGDAAGMITPLCGNGMSIALHTAKLASQLIHAFLEKQIAREELEIGYINAWKKNFAGRLATGRRLQVFFGNTRWSDLFVSTFRALPFLAAPVIKMTHGKRF